MDGIVYERGLEEGKWQCVNDHWPEGVLRAQLQYNNEPPFGDYEKEEAVKLIIHTITKGNPHFNSYSVLSIGSTSKKKKEKQMREETKEEVLGIATLSGAAVELPDEGFGIESAEQNLPERETAVLKTRKPRTKVDLERVKSLYAEGKTVGEIAEATGVSYMGVRLALINAKLLTPKTRTPKEE